MNKTLQYIELPYPLREGRLCYFRIPQDLLKEEVERLERFMLSLCIDGQPLREGSESMSDSIDKIIQEN